MKKYIALLLAVVMIITIPLTTAAKIVWVDDEGNSFTMDITDIASAGTVNEANIESVMGEGWSIYNPNNTDISTTFGISQSTSATYNKDHMLEINRKADSGQYHVIGIKKDFNEPLNGKVKLSFETVADNSTNIYIYNNEGNVIARLRYHSNALKLTTAKSAETTIFSVTYATSLLNWELGFDLLAGTMDLSIATSQNYSSAPSGAAANLDTTSTVRTVKTKTPFEITDGATDLKSFVVGTNVYGTRARILSLGVDVQSWFEVEDPAATLESVTNSKGKIVENISGSIDTLTKYINVNFSNELDANTVSCLKILKDGDEIATYNTLSDDKKSIKVEFDGLEVGDYTISFDGVYDINDKQVECEEGFAFSVTEPLWPEVESVTTYDNSELVGELSPAVEKINVKFNVPMKPSLLTKENIVILADGTPLDYTASIEEENTKYVLSFDSLLPLGEYQLILSNLLDENELELNEVTKDFVIAKKSVEINENFNEYEEGTNLAETQMHGWEYYNADGGGTTSIVYNPNSKLNELGLGPINEKESATFTVPFPEQTARFEIEFPLCNIGGGAQPYIELYGNGKKSVRFTLPSRVFRLATDFTKGDYDESTIILFGKDNSDYKFGATVPVTVKFVVDMATKTFDLSLTHASLVGYSGAYNKEAGVTVDTTEGTATIRNVPLLGDVKCIDAIKFGSVWDSAQAPVVTLRYLKITSLPSVESVCNSFGGEVKDGDTISVRNNAFVLKFSDEADKNSLKNISLTTEDEKTIIPVTGKFLDDKCYEISFDELEKNTNYVLKLSGIRALSGKMMNNRAEIPFRTGDKLFRVASETFSSDEIGNNTAVTASAELTNESDEVKNAVMLVFQYSADGIAKSVAARCAEVPVAQISEGELIPGTTTLSTEIILKNKAEGDYIEVYTWEDLVGGNIISSVRNLR